MSSLLVLALFSSWAHAATQVPKEPFRAKPDQTCPKVQVRCLSEQGMKKECNGAPACAIQATCTMYVDLQMCGMLGLKNQETLTGSQFRERTQCATLPAERVFRYGFKEFMSNCSSVRHEYAHLFDFVRSDELHRCSESFAQEREIVVQHAMFKRYCPINAKGKTFLDCVDACYQAANQAAVTLWDTCMCRQLKERFHGQRGGGGITQQDCLRCRKETAHHPRYVELYPAFCKVHEAANLTSYERASLADHFLSEESGHGCDYYDGPAWKADRGFVNSGSRDKAGGSPSSSSAEGGH